VKEYSYWWDTVPSPPPGNENAKATTAALGRRWDVAIVGAGYTGLAAARQLAKAGALVVVLERENIGWGASSRNGGQVLTGLRVDAATLVARYGESRARGLFEVAVESQANLERLIVEERIDCDLHRAGHIVAAWKPAHFAAFRAEQALLARVFNHHVELVPRTEQRAEIGSDVYHGLLVDEHSGALNPARYVHGLAAAARRAGATIACGTAVERFERRSSRWVLTTTGGEVDTADVLMATNGYTDRASPSLQRRFVPVGSHVIATAPLAAADAERLLPRRRVAFDSKHFLYYFRVTADRRLLFGGRAGFSRPAADTTRRAAGILRAGMRTVFPELAEVAIEYAWGGNVAFTRDEMPRAGKLEDAYYAGGYCGHGIALATLLGSLIARRIAGEPIEHPLFDDRFAPIPLYRGTPWFLPLVGAYYTMKDWLQ
jgi:glycine/D-amino acid oxidase-like deaminating enzyme